MAGTERRGRALTVLDGLDLWASFVHRQFIHFEFAGLAMDDEMEAGCEQRLQHGSKLVLRDGAVGLGVDIVLALGEPFRTAENLWRLDP